MSDESIERHGREINALASTIEAERAAQGQRADRIDALVNEVHRLAEQTGISISVSRTAPEGRPVQAAVPQDLAAAAGCLDAETLRKLDHDFFGSVPAVPPMDDLDRFVIIAVGCLAALADFFLVGLPPNTKWTPGKECGGLPVGWVAKRIKEWSVDNDNWLARLCSVPFDRTTFSGTKAGYSPVNHRVLSFGHDPSPIGFVFGLMDIVSGGMTGVTRDGQPLYVLSEAPASWSRIAFAALIWLGHLISDIATPMGLPIPGSSLLQIVRIPVPGAPDSATVGDVMRILYQQGYDFRHYVTAGVVPGLIEGLIRLYDILRHGVTNESLARGAISAGNVQRYVTESNDKARLVSRLFWTHAIATGANTGRVAIQGCMTGDFFSAVRAINLAQWQMFAVQTIRYASACCRDTTLDQATKNRKQLDAGWDDLMSNLGSVRVLYSPTSPPSSKIVL